MILALSASKQVYAVAVRTLGASSMRICGRHIRPNIANALIVSITLNIPQAILLETSLSFLGRDYLLTAWWLATLPALVIFLTTLAFALLGDRVRDKLDPTGRK